MTRRNDSNQRAGRSYSNRASFIAYLGYVLAALCLIIMLSPVPLMAGGGPDSPDSYTIGRYYAQDWSLTSTNSATFVDKLTLTFTPPATAYYLIKASAVLESSTVNSETEARLLDKDGTTVLGMSDFKGTATGSCESMDAHRVEQLTGGVSVTFKVQYRMITTLAELRDTTITAIELTSSNTVEANSEQTNNTTSPVTACTLSFTPPAQADYLIIATADISNSNPTKLSAADLYYGGATSWGANAYSPKIANDYGNFFSIRKVNLTAASQTLALRFWSLDGGNTAAVRNARISAVKVSDLGTVQYAEQTLNTQADNTTTAPSAAATVGPLSFGLGHYWIMMNGFMQENSTSSFVENMEVLAGTTFDTHKYQPDDVRAWQTVGHDDFWHVSAGSHTYDQKFASSTADIRASITNARVWIAKMDTLESYSASSHASAANSFSGSGTTVYMWAHGQDSSTYAVGYYDADGTLQATDGSLSASASGQVASQYVLNSHPSAAAGTWHAALFDTTIGSPPSTWSSVSSADGYIVSDSFTVLADAIPEFPTVVAGLAVAGICAGIYMYMKRRSAPAGA